MLRGYLDVFSVDEILELVGQARSTGALRVFGPHTVGAVYCSAGSITYATADENEDLLSFLQRSAFVREGENAYDATSLIELLMDDEQDMHRLHDFVRQSTEERVFEMSLWRQGELHFEQGEDHRFGDAFNHPMQVVLNGVRERRARWNELESLLPPLDTVLVQVPVLPPDREEVTVTRAQWGVLTAVDGRKSLRELASHDCSGLFSTAEQLVALIEAGLVTGPWIPAQSSSAEEPLAAQAPAELEGLFGGP